MVSNQPLFQYLSGLFTRGLSGRGMKLTTFLYLLPRLNCMQRYHPPKCFNDLGLNYVEGERQKVKGVRHDNVFLADHEIYISSQLYSPAALFPQRRPSVHIGYLLFPFPQTDYGDMTVGCPWSRNTFLTSDTLICCGLVLYRIT